MPRHNDRSTVFKFKHFALSNVRSPMKIGTDGVLLGAIAGECCKHIDRILDIGTGTGVIALMLAQRFPDAQITALDIDQDAGDEANFNVANSPFADRVHVDIVDFKEYVSTEKYDLIVSNPPFYNEDVRCPDARRDSARHEASLPLRILIERSTVLLSETGHLEIVLPYSRIDELKLDSMLAGLHIKRLTMICPKDSRQPKRVIACLSKRANPVKTEETRITIRDENNEYTKEYKSLLKDFYLAF